MKPVVMYTLRGCPFCVRARALLDAKLESYTEIDVTSDHGGRERVRERTGHPTFPQIFIGDLFVGGCNELLSLERSGRLDELLAA